MKSLSITAEKREAAGKKGAKALRAEGIVPGVIYGKGEPTLIQMDERKYKNILFTPKTFLIELNLDGVVRKTILKDASFDPLTDKIAHADFYEIDENEPFEVSIPVKFTGSSKGVLAGGTLRIKRRSLKLKGLLKDIPEEIAIDITEMGIGSITRVRDVKVEGVTILDPASDLVVSVKASRKSAAMAGDGK
jgi:large subunit ribosomal protein L25